MQPLVKETEWFRLEVDAWGNLPRVRVLGRWAYRWTEPPGVSKWTEPEKKFFHALVSGLVRTTFAGARLLMRATRVPFATTLGLEFDVGWALEQHKHWTVYVLKMPPGATPTTFPSGVFPAAKTIVLDSADLIDYYVCNPAGKCGVTNAIPHEFMHTVGNHYDEYQTGSPHLGDARSVLNAGKQLRERHLEYILKHLHELVPNARFSLA